MKFVALVTWQDRLFALTDDGHLFEIKARSDGFAAERVLIIDDEEEGAYVAYLKARAEDPARHRDDPYRGQD